MTAAKRRRIRSYRHRRRSDPTGVARTPSGEAGLKSAFARDWTRRARKLEKLCAIPPDKLSVDEVHDLRVTTRRLRASLSLLRRCADMKRERGARRELRTLGRALGARRMLDIAIRDAERYGADTAPLRKRHVRASAALVRTLRRKRAKSLLDDLAAIAKEIPAAPFARLWWRFQDFEWELAYRAERLPRTAEEWHELRIELKKVRYVLEALGRRSVPLERLQDHLGREHDLGVLQTLIGKERAIAKDERAARLCAERVMAAALRSAMKNLQWLRREIVR